MYVNDPNQEIIKKIVSDNYGSYQSTINNTIKEYFINVNDFNSALTTLTNKRYTYVAMKKHIIGCVVEHKVTGQTCIIQSVIHGSGFNGLGGWYSRYNSYFEVLTTNGSNVCVNDLIFFDDEMNQLTYGQYTDKFWPPQQLTARF